MLANVFCMISAETWATFKGIKQSRKILSHWKSTQHKLQYTYQLRSPYRKIVIIICPCLLHIFELFILKGSGSYTPLYTGNILSAHFQSHGSGIQGNWQQQQQQQHLKTHLSAGQGKNSFWFRLFQVSPVISSVISVGFLFSAWCLAGFQWDWNTICLGSLSSLRFPLLWRGVLWSTKCLRTAFSQEREDGHQCEYSPHCCDKAGSKWPPQNRSYVCSQTDSCANRTTTSKSQIY